MLLRGAPGGGRVKKSPVFGENLTHPGPQHDGSTVDRLSPTPFAQNPDPTKLRLSLLVPRPEQREENGSYDRDITCTARIPSE
jgi:hypothetical protein